MNSTTADQYPGDSDTAKVVDVMSAPAPEPSLDRARKPKKAQFKREKYDIHGWVALDKPIGMTSTHAVAVIKRLFTARRAGHAGTLDPLATGLLPIALGEATKTVPYVMDGLKTYRFTLRFGEARATDDAEGEDNAIRAALPAFCGLISQRPPIYSALKVEGQRAYDLARAGEAVELAPREI